MFTIPLPLVHQITTRPSHICCLSIWLLVTFLSTVLFRQMRSAQTVKKIWKRKTAKLLVFAAIFAVLLYELWMFSFIHNVYAVEFAFVLRLIILLPLVTLLLHTMYQTCLLAYHRACYPHGTDTIYHLVTCIVFNSIMAFHIMCMVLTSIVKFEFKSCMVLMSLGMVELIYRLWIIREFILLLAFHYSNPQPTSPVSEQGDDDKGGPLSYRCIGLQEQNAYPELTLLVCGVTITSSFYVLQVSAQ